MTSLDSIVLTEEEIKEAILEAKKKKFFRLKHIPNGRCEKCANPLEILDGHLYCNHCDKEFTP